MSTGSMDGNVHWVQVSSNGTIWLCQLATKICNQTYPRTIELESDQSWPRLLHQTINSGTVSGLLGVICNQQALEK